MYEEILERLGFSPAESAVFTTLLGNGTCTAAFLVEKTGLGRGNVYNGLEALRRRGLVTAVDGKKMEYRLEHPEKLFTVLAERRQKVNEAFDAAQAALPDMIARYAATTERPIVWTGVGIPAVKAAYADMLAHAKDICIFPSAFDREDPRLDRIIEAATQEQQKKGIAVRALFGRVTRENTPYDFQALARMGIASRVLPVDELGLKAQILLWGDNVIMNALRSDVVIATITHPDIAQAMRRIFEVLWQSGVDPLAAARGVPSEGTR